MCIAQNPEQGVCHWLTSLLPFFNKIKKIRDTFASSGTVNEVHPPSDPPKITAFSQVLC